MPRGVVTINGTTFYLLSADDVRQRSVVEIHEHVLTERSGEPKANGALDLRLGTVEPRFRCATCGGTVRTCAGHTGHIELPVPVYNVIFLPQILLVLRCLCCACARPLLSPERARDLGRGLRRPQDRLSKIAASAKDVSTCPHDDCHMPTCNYTKTTAADAASGIASGIMRQWSAAALEKIDPEDRTFFAASTFGSWSAYALLSLVTPDDWASLGFKLAERSNPRDMIITTLTVPPAIIRPTSFHYDTGQGRGTNDLTAALQDILRQANKVRALLPTLVFDGNADVVRTLDADDGSVLTSVRGPIDHLLLFRTMSTMPATEISGLHKAIGFLQQCVNAYIFNDPRSMAPTSGAGRRQTGGGGASSQRSGAPRTSVLGRLKGNNEQGGKLGRWRHSCLGKRSDNTARSVIVPDPALDIDELGVPEVVARTLAVRDRVCSYNAEDLSQRVRLGPGKSGGAISVIRAVDAEPGCGDAERDATIDLRAYDVAHAGPLILHIGDVVERHLCDGDTIVFNRQPSLHRKSMMSFRMRVVSDLAFHLNPAITTPFNADYDGDEMNAHVATDTKAVAEMRSFMSVPAQILSGQTNSPCAGLVQDGIIGCWLLTDPATTVSRVDVMDYVMQMDATHRAAGGIDGLACIPPPTCGDRWSGVQVASLPLPRDFTWCDERRTIVVECGQIIVGRLDKRTIGPGGALLGALVHKCGAVRALVALSDMQRIAVRFLERRGISCGPRDSVLGAQHAAALERNVDDVLRKTYASVFDASISATRAQRESAVVRNLGALMDRIGRALPDVLPKDNALVQMQRSGAKGNAFNLCQITAALGQTLVEGQRPNPRADDIMLPASVVGAAASSVPYLPCCFARTNMHGRSDAVVPDPVTLAADRGFIQQSYVRGLDPKAYYMHAMGGREGLVDTAVRTAESGYFQRKLMKALEDLKVEHDGTIRDAAGNIVQFVYGGDGHEPSELVRQLVDPSIASCISATAPLIVDRGAEDVMPEETRCTLPFYISDIERIMDNDTDTDTDNDTDPAFGNDAVDDAFDCDSEFTGVFTRRESIVLRWVLRGRSTAAVHAALRSATIAVERARIQPGESVGAVAAHSIAQPATQMTLNSFHVAGKSQRHALGVGRLYELVDVRGKRGSATIGVEIPIRHQWHDSGPKIARSMKRALVGIPLNMVVARFDVIHTRQRMPDGVLPASVKAASQSWLAYQVAVAKAESTMADNLEAVWVASAIALGEIDWTDEKRRPRDQCLRFAISASAMAKYDVDLETIRGAIETTLRGANAARPEWVVAAAEAGAPPVVRAYCVSARGRSGKASSDVYSTRGRQIMSSTIVRGVRGVTSVEHDATTHTIRAIGADALGAVLVTQCMALDYGNMYCNSPIACAARFGIDYASMVLGGELWRVMRSNGTYIDARHIVLLADAMTHRGYLVPINRHGLNRLDTDPIVRCCFEQSTDVIRNAALHTESSTMRSVSERVVFGQPIPVGTGTVEIHERDKTMTMSVSTTMHCTEIGLIPHHFCDLRGADPAMAEIAMHMQPAPATCASVLPRSAAMWRAGIELLNESDETRTTPATATATMTTTKIDARSLFPPGKQSIQSLSTVPDILRIGSTGRRRGTLAKYCLPRRSRKLFRPSTPIGDSDSETNKVTEEIPPVVVAPNNLVTGRQRVRSGPRWRPWSPSVYRDEL